MPRIFVAGELRRPLLQDPIVRKGLSRGNSNTHRRPGTRLLHRDNHAASISVSLNHAP